MSKPGAESWSGPVGRIGAALLASAVSDIAKRRVHICGPAEMMEATKTALLELGVASAEAFGTVKRNPRAKGSASSEIAGKVVFRTSQTTADVRADETILDAADGAEVFIDNACRSGTCGSCRVRLFSGRVTMAVEEALTTRDKVDGCILACQAKVSGDVEVDA